MRTQIEDNKMIRHWTTFTDSLMRRTRGSFAPKKGRHHEIMPWHEMLDRSAVCRVGTRQSGAAPVDTEPTPWQAAWGALPEWTTNGQRPETDWLIDARPFPAHVYRGTAANELVLANGLIARTFRLAPNAATVGLDQLVTGEAMLRGVKPEAVVEIDGQRFEVGGLTGQPNYAFLRREWLDDLRADPAAFRFVGFEVGRPNPRFAWKQVRHCAPGSTWPPAGVSLRLDFVGRPTQRS